MHTLAELAKHDAALRRMVRIYCTLLALEFTVCTMHASKGA